MSRFGINDINKRLVVLGNRNDFCYLCATEIEAKNERDYNIKFNSLKGILEGRPVVKIRRGGTETVICMKCINTIAKENPEESTEEE